MTSSIWDFVLAKTIAPGKALLRGPFESQSF